ncbi:Endo-chitosanase [Mycena kentingensis (nom. inval.)]|nr:Endo-chitosanase [Mycena kentingensis (nom. inval.)]
MSTRGPPTKNGLVALPSLSNSLNQLPQVKSMSNVSLHNHMYAQRAKESQQLLQTALGNGTAYPNCPMPGAPAGQGGAPLMMRAPQKSNGGPGITDSLLTFFVPPRAAFAALLATTKINHNHIHGCACGAEARRSTIGAGLDLDLASTFRFSGVGICIAIPGFSFILPLRIDTSTYRYAYRLPVQPFISRPALRVRYSRQTGTFSSPQHLGGSKVCTQHAFTILVPNMPPLAIPTCEREKPPRNGAVPPSGSDAHDLDAPAVSGKHWIATGRLAVFATAVWISENQVITEPASAT